MKSFYGIYVNGALRYVGKGHRDLETGYDRLSHYAVGADLKHLTRRVYDELTALRAAGEAWEARVIQEVESERHALHLERELTEPIMDQLWNQRVGGQFAGSTLSAAAKRKMSLARVGKELKKASLETRIKMAAAKKGRKQSREMVAKRVAGALATSKKNRDSKIHFPSNRLVATPRRQSHNARLTPEQEVEFLSTRNGTHAAEELRRDLCTLTNREMCITSIYRLIKMYGGHTVLSRMSPEEKRLRKIKIVTARRTLAAKTRLGLI